jgi:uncharacterized protein with FMN-binding domain
MGLGVLAAAYKSGIASTEATLSAQGNTPVAPSTDTGNTPAPTPSSSSEPAPTHGSNGSNSGTKTPVKPVNPVTPVTPVDPAPPVDPATSNTQSGDAVTYRYGTVQVSVTKTGGSISGITMLMSGATSGRKQAFPTLIDWAIAANGSNFSNYSQATFTTAAFKKSLDTALAKF